MKRCPKCKGNNPVWVDLGSGICSTCGGVKIAPMVIKRETGGSTAVAERQTVSVCLDCYGTSVCQYCMGFGFVS